MKNKENKFEKLEKMDVTTLSKQEQMEIMGGMQWTGSGSKNVEMDKWTALTVGDPWGGRFGIKIVD